MQKKCNRLKKLKLKWEKKKKKRKTKEKKKKTKHSTELQKPNVEAEVYNGNKKCD